MKRFFEKTYRLTPTDGVLTGAVRARDEPEITAGADAGSGHMRRKPLPAVISNGAGRSICLCAEAYGKIAYRSDDLLIQRRNNESYSTTLS